MLDDGDTPGQTLCCSCRLTQVLPSLNNPRNGPRWIAGTAAMPSCREHFGDETADYAQALARHYAEGPPADWSQHFISPYASAHPWKDWAETCAHYLLVVDAVQTTASWGLQLSGHLSATPHDTDLKAPSDVQHLVLEQRLPVAQFLNAMNRSLGLLNSYPFQMPAAVLDKLAAVQQLLRGAAGLRQPPPRRQVP